MVLSLHPFLEAYKDRRPRDTSRGSPRVMTMETDGTIGWEGEGCTEQDEFEEVVISDHWPPEEMEERPKEEEMVEVEEMEEDDLSWEDVYSLNGCSTFFG